MNWEQVQQEALVRTSRSGGPGGQHVNKVETKVELVFYPANSLAFSDKEKALVLKQLADKLTSDGALQVSSQEARSQLKNKERAWKKLEQLLLDALVPPKPVRTASAFVSPVKVRRERKSRQSEKKAMRRPPDLLGSDGD